MTQNAKVNIASPGKNDAKRIFVNDIKYFAPGLRGGGVLALAAGGTYAPAPHGQYTTSAR
jgi:hypothetical protein